MSHPPRSSIALVRAALAAVLVVLAGLAPAARAAPAAPPSLLRHTLGVDVAGGAWFGGAHMTVDLRYGFDVVPALQVGVVAGMSVLDDASPRATVYARLRLLRGGDATRFHGHALTIALAAGALFERDYPFFEAALGWEFRHPIGIGVGTDSGLVHSLTDESGWPFARLRVGWSW